LSGNKYKDHTRMIIQIPGAINGKVQANNITLLQSKNITLDENLDNMLKTRMKKNR